MTNVPMTRPDGLIASHEYDHPEGAGNMWAAFVELRDGRIMQLADSHFSTSGDGGVTWSDTYGVCDADGDLVRGSGLVRLSDDRILLRGSEQDREGRVKLWTSKDEGETWQVLSRPRLPGGGKTIIRTSSGRLILASTRSVGQRGGPEPDDWPKPGKLVHGQWVKTSAHYYDPSLSCAFVYYSDDEGRTWHENRDGGLLVMLDWNGIFSFTNETSVTEVAPGKLLMFMRTGLGRLFQSWSHDSGETWTRPAATSLASSTAPPQIKTFSNGHLLCVWNQQSEEEVRQGYLRTRLSSAVSRNGGSLWEFFQNVESIHEETRVVPGPVQLARPAEYHFGPEVPAPELDDENVTPADALGTWTYPSVTVFVDRVFVAYRYTLDRAHPEYAQLVGSSKTQDAYGFILKLKVFPLSWFYGGKKPADPLIRYPFTSVQI